MGISDLFSHALDNIFTLASSTVTYSRGADSVELQVVVSKGLVSFDEIGEVRTRTGERQFRIRQADLIIDSVLTYPMQYDTITFNGDSYVVQDEESYESDALDETYLVTAIKG